MEKIADMFTLNGFIRLRANSYNNFDLDEDVKEDNHNDFIDIRSFLSLKVQSNAWSAVVSIDVAGNDFNDGALLGNEDPGKNGRIELDLRHAYIQYKKDLMLRLGRQPARLGHGIVANIVRDMAKVGWGFQRFGLTGIYVKGAEGITQTTASTRNSRRVLGASNGADQDLDAFGLALNAPSLLEKRLSLQLYTMRKFDTTDNNRYAEHMLVGLSADGALFQDFSYQLEANYMGGKTANGAQGATANERADIEAVMVYADGTYNYGNFFGGVAFGFGSGDNDPTDREFNNFPSFFMDETGFTYTYIFSDDLHGYDGRSSDNGFGSGFANVTWIQAHCKYLWRQLTIEGSYTYLRATKSQLVGSGPLGLSPTTSSSRSRDIGDEIDAHLSYDFDEHVRVYIKAGIFFPGRIYGNADSAVKSEAGLEFRF